MKAGRVFLLGFFSSLMLLLSGCGNKMTAGQKDEMGKFIHEYVVAHPEIIVEALQELQKHQMENTEKKFEETRQVAPQHAEQLFHDNTNPVSGNAQGSVTLVEFFDYRCPHCLEASPVIAALVKANPDLRVVYKEFPIFGAPSEFASKMALAAANQHKYFEFHDALMHFKGQLKEADVIAIATSLKLDMAQLKKEMDSPEIQKIIKDNTQLARDLKLLGTPAFFVAKVSDSSIDHIQYSPGRPEQVSLQGLIDSARK